MSSFDAAPPSGVYAAMRSIFKTLASDQLLCKYLYYPSKDMDDDPSVKPDLTNEQRFEVIKITERVTELEEPNELKRGRINFGLGFRPRSYSNQTASRQTFLVYIFMPRDGFDSVDFRTAACIDRIDQLLSDKAFEGTFGRIVKEDSNPFESPRGYEGYLLRYQFSDTD